MIRKILTILIALNSVLCLAQNRRLIKELYGLRPVKDVRIEEYPWLRSTVFNGMTLFGDTLFISKAYKAKTSSLDAEAGENNMLRQKFIESRQVMITDFMNKKLHKVEVLGGDFNYNVNSGGLMLKRNSKAGIMPVLNYSMRKSEMYYVELEKNAIRKISPWEGNENIDFAVHPSFFKKRDGLVFETHANSRDLAFWDADKMEITPYKYNSEADDINPYIFNDSLLFFSSNRANKGNFDLYFQNLNYDNPPQLLFPEVLQTDKDELAITFLNDSVSIVSKREGENMYTYNHMKVDLGWAPNSYLPIPEHLLEKPINKDAKILREQGRLAQEMFMVNYGEQLTVKKPENLFLDSVKLNPYAVRIIENVLRKDNLIDVSFFLPFEIDDTAFQSKTYSIDKTMASGIKKIAQLLTDIKDTHVLIIGFASAPGGSDLNLMRSYFQSTSFKMQLNELNGIPESNIHILVAGDYINTVHSDLNVKQKNNVGAVYIYKNKKVPALLTAYKMSSIETPDIVAGRLGISMSTLTYSNLLLIPFLDIPDDLLFLPVRDITMLWKGNDLSETATQYDISLNHLMRVNGLQEPIIKKQSIIYIPQ